MAGKVWFSLIPTNEVSTAIVNDSRNESRVVTTDAAQAATSKVIQVVFADNLQPHPILSFGRDVGNHIKCDPPGTTFGRRMAQRQCSFCFHNRSLILRDHSEGHTTTISPLHLHPPSKWRMDQTPRQCAIPEFGDWRISMGTAQFLLQFSQDKRWWEQNFGEKDALAKKKVPSAVALTEFPPQDARRETRVQIPNVPEEKKHAPIVYHELDCIGKGAIGSVSRVMDLQSGLMMAVKIMTAEDGKEKDLKETAKREVELIASLSHTHIVDFIHSQGWELGKPVQIFMPLADGSLRGYSSTKMEKREVVLVSKQIMAALTYLHGQEIVHGDVKPENILYESRTTGLNFLLADFGYAKRIGSKTKCVGTQIYFAPEVWSSAEQDFGLDIWSLGVLIYEMSNDLDFTQRSGLPDSIFSPKVWCERLEIVCRNGGDLAKMVTADLNQRATANDLNASASFPDVPDNLPCVFDLPGKQQREEIANPISRQVPIRRPPPPGTGGQRHRKS